ncbi:MAG: hypothetical protein K2L54_02325, partial [Clostridiales bacterium]|nr:hypothetical protein [Clostridiales bacterium]
LKYRDRFMRYGMFNVAAMASEILFAIVLLFVPMFSIDLIITTEWFSLFDEISLVFKGMFNGGSTFYILGGISMIAAIIMGFVYIIKQVIAMTNADGYALQCYDDIKKRNGVESRIRRFEMSGKGLLPLVIISVLIFVFGIVFSTVLGGKTENVSSYFSICTGVNGLIVFAILFLLAAIVSIVMSSSIDGKIKFEIMKKEYDEPADNEDKKVLNAGENKAGAEVAAAGEGIAKDADGKEEK